MQNLFSCIKKSPLTNYRYNFMRTIWMAISLDGSPLAETCEMYMYTTYDRNVGYTKLTTGA